MLEGVEACDAPLGGGGDVRSGRVANLSRPRELASPCAYGGVEEFLESEPVATQARSPLAVQWYKVKVGCHYQ